MLARKRRTWRLMTPLIYLLSLVRLATALATAFAFARVVVIPRTAHAVAAAAIVSIAMVPENGSTHNYGMNAAPPTARFTMVHQSRWPGYVKRYPTWKCNMTPTRDECHKDACSSLDQQFSRILRRWSAEPFGEFDDDCSNHQKLRKAMEFFICPIIKRAPKAGLHEFWCDGLDFVVWSRAEHSCFFGGACIYSDRHCNSEWLAPFELRIEYDEQDFDCPSSVDLRLGHADQSDQISKRYPSGRRYRLYAMAHCLYGSRPDSLSDWAIHVNLSPFRIG